MNITIQKSTISHSEEDGYIGQVQFTAEGHQQPYEITLLSKNGIDWDYSLHFAEESGTEEAIIALETALEEDDELFNQLLDAVLDP